MLKFASNTSNVSGCSTSTAPDRKASTGNAASTGTSGSGHSGRIWVPALDGLRLWASVNIVLFHMTVMGAFRDVHAGDWWLVWIKAPALHASVFFLLGGFLYYLKFSRKHPLQPDSQSHPLQIGSQSPPQQISSQSPPQQISSQSQQTSAKLSPDLSYSSQFSFSARHFLWDRLRRLYPLHFLTTMLMALFVYSIPPDNWGEALRSVGMHLGLLWSLWPFDTHTLNQPSWAISAFFVAYLCFAPVFRRVRTLSPQGVQLSAGLLVGLMLVWSLVFISGEFTTARYTFFHIFGPVRALEFFAGMLLARWVELRTVSGKDDLHTAPSAESAPLQKTNPNPFTRSFTSRSLTGLLILLVILGSSSAVYGSDWHIRWLHYHNFLPVTFAALIWICAQGRSLPERFFALKWLRPAGQASFAPYLLHVPVLSIYCWYMAKYEHKYEVFASPVAIAGAMAALYGTATAARLVSDWYYARNRNTRQMQV